MNRYDALKAAMEALGDLTPLKTNCGKYCGGACCEPDETGDNGMLLFPGEEENYREPIEGMPFRLLDDDTLFEGGKRFVCEGKCVRNRRPLACRLFPLRIHPSTGKAEPDPRAWAVCPLLERGGMRGMSQDFVCAVERAGEALLQCEEIRRVLEDEQRMLDETRVL